MLGKGLTTPTLKAVPVTKYLKESWNSTDSLARPENRKMDMRFVTWNVSSLYRAGSLKTVGRELVKCKVDIVRAQEVG
jgi:hypothetical protein